jgi:PAS domain S-box-containing protein
MMLHELLRRSEKETGMRRGTPVSEFQTERLHLERLGQLYDKSLVAIIANCLNSVILCYVLKNNIQMSLLVAWLLAVQVLTLLRSFLYYRYKHATISFSDFRKWYLLALTGIGLSGILWGITGIILFPENSIFHQVFVAFLLGGMIAGAVGTYSVVLTAFLLFSLPAAAPIIIRFMLIGDDIHFAMGVLSLIFWVLMLFTARRFNVTISTSINLKFQNTDLIQELRSEIKEREKIEIELLENQRHIESIVKARTTELKSVNRKLNKKIEDHRRSEKALLKSEEKYRNLVENINDIIYTTNQDGVVNYISPAVKSVLGYRPEEILGRHYSDFIYQEDVSRINEEFQKRLSGHIEPGEYRILNKSGDIRWVRSSSLPIKEGDRTVGLRGVLTDITESRQLEVRLQQAHKMEAIGTLAGGIAHDFNNVLGIIMGNTELAMGDVPEWNPAHDHLKEIKTAIKRAKEIVSQLLRVSRKTETNRIPVNSIHVIEESLKLLRATLPKTIAIRQTFPVKCDTILADPTQIHQVMINLGTNAAHAMRERGGILEVSLSNLNLGRNASEKIHGLLPGNYVKLTIKDTGHGIDPKNQDRIFDPYFTTKGFGEGSGMGLAVVHGIVKRCKGEITVDSEVGKGTTFNIYFPVTKAPVVMEQKRSEMIPKGNEKIMLVDDEASIAAIGKEMLSRLGYQVKAGTDPLQALEVVKADPKQFDLVVLDMTMPQMTGDRLAKEILKIRSDMPMILCTGYSEKMDEKRAEALGLKAFVMKPMTMIEIATTVRKVLDERKKSPSQLS